MHFINNRSPLLLLALVAVSCGCSTGYKEVDGKYAYVTWDEGHGRRARVLDDADKETLTALNDRRYAKDKNKVFLKGVTVLEADPDTFELLEFPYARDKIQAYCGTVPIKVDNVDEFQVLLGFSGGYLSSTGGSDLEHNFGKITTVSPDATIWVAHGWARDDKYCYHGPTRLAGADPETFAALDHLYAKDDKNAYFTVGIIPDADAATFRVMGATAAQDKFRRYVAGTEVKSKSE